MTNLTDVVTCAEMDEARAVADAYDLPLALTMTNHLDSCRRCSQLDGPPAETPVPPELATLAGRQVWREDDLRAALLLASRANPQYGLAVMTLLAERAAEARPAEAWVGFARMLLDAEDAEVAVAAVGALAELVPTEGAAEGLRIALEADFAHVRAAAARAIAADPAVAKRPEVLESLAAALGDTEQTDAEIRWHAAAALGAAGPPAAKYQSALIAALIHDSSWLVRRAAAFALESAGLAGQFGVLEALRNAANTDEDEDVREAAAAVLAPPPEWPRIIAKLGQIYRSVREALHRDAHAEGAVAIGGPRLVTASGGRRTIMVYGGDEPEGAKAQVFAEKLVVSLRLESPADSEPGVPTGLVRWWEVRFPMASGEEAKDGIKWAKGRDPGGFRAPLGPGRSSWQGRLGWLVDDLPETRDAARRALADIDAVLKEAPEDEGVDA